MSHPKELIDSIAAMLAKEYPADAGYQYVFERAIPGTRMQPDILISHDGRHVCAVEIGYTRPEKLSAYRRELKIPDVRWYDKQGALHADVTEKVVRVSVEIKTTPPADLSVYFVMGWVPCVDCPELEGVGVPDRCADRFIRLFGEDAYDARQDKVDEDEHYDVLTCVVTDFSRIWFPSYCDKCGKEWLADPSNEAMLLKEPFAHRTARELGHQFGARQLVSWEKAYAEVQENFGLAIDDEGHYIDNELQKTALQLAYVKAHARVDEEISRV